MTVYKFLPDGCFGVFFTAVDDMLLIFFLVLYTVAKCSLKGTVLPALYGRQSFIWVLSHVFPPFFLSRSPRKGFLPRWRKLRIVRFTASGKTHSLRCSSSPHKAMRLCGGPDNSGVFRRWHAPHSFGTSCPEVTSGQSVQKLAPCGASPAGVFLFGRSFIFQGAAHR